MEATSSGSMAPCSSSSFAVEPPPRDWTALHAQLWSFVEFAASLSPDEDNERQSELLHHVQKCATRLLLARQELASSEQTDFHVQKRLPPQTSLTPVERRPSSASGSIDTAEDQSDTLSDCTVLTEASSVYGISNTWVDLAILYASPFVVNVDTASDPSSAPGSGSSRRLKAVAPLNFVQEQLQLTRIFQECQKAIHTIRMVANVESIRKVLDRGITALHFSAHGGRIAGQDTCLMLEDARSIGLAHFVNASTLRQILRGGNAEKNDGTPGEGNNSLASSFCSLKLVFVSSCHSRDIGEVFIQAGVAHVVCVHHDERVLDESASLFAHSFYGAVLQGKSIHQSFEIARVQVSSDLRTPANEGDRFVLLESSHVHSQECPLYASEVRAIEVCSTCAKCECTSPTNKQVFTDIPVGKWVDVAPTPNKYQKTLPSVSESFVGREQELHMLADLVTTKRFVTLRGPPGIGKSTLAIKLAHFLGDRCVFADGVTFISLRGVSSVESMESAMQNVLFPDSGNASSGGGGIVTTSDKGVMALHMRLRDMEVMLVLDNMEDPLSANPANVREFLLHLLQTCHKVSFFMTSRHAMGGGISGFDEKVVSLNRLSPFHAIDLFLKKAPRALALSEISSSAVTSSANSLATGSNPTTFVYEALLTHPLMNFLDGHPQAISLCAPLLQDRSLGELTRIVLNRGVSELQVVGLQANDRSAVNTLVISLSVSLDQLKLSHNMEAVRFFALLGLLPAGAMAADFKSLWGDKWESFVAILLRFSLIQRNRMPGFTLTKRGMVNNWSSSSSSAGSSRKMGHHHHHPSRNRRSADSSASDNQRQLLAALKAYTEYISSPGTTTVSSTSARGNTSNVNTGGLLNSLTRNGRASSRHADHLADQLDNEQEHMQVCVHYSTFPFITSYARSLLGMYDGEGAKQLDAKCGGDDEETDNVASDSQGCQNDSSLTTTICSEGDRDLFLYNCARHFFKVSYWVFHYICTLTSRSNAAYLILEMHEANLWMCLDLHIKMVEQWALEETQPSEETKMLRARIAESVMEVACLFAHVLFLSGRHRGAWNATNKSLHIAKTHRDSLSEANTRKLMGILLSSETKFDEAKAQFGMALILYKAGGDKLGQAASLSGIGMIHCRKGNLRGAHNCFTKALTLYEWFNHALGQLNCHQRLANLEKKLRDGEGFRMAARNAASTALYSHHYAATRRLQGDLNRKRSREYVVRWVGHEMSLLLELPSLRASQRKDEVTTFGISNTSISSTNCSGGGGNMSASTSGTNATCNVSGASPSVDLCASPTNLTTSTKYSTIGVTNTPKKNRLANLIEQKEREQHGDNSTDISENALLQLSSFTKRRGPNTSTPKNSPNHDSTSADNSCDKETLMMGMMIDPSDNNDREV